MHRWLYVVYWAKRTDNSVVQFIHMKVIERLQGLVWDLSCSCICGWATLQGSEQQNKQVSVFIAAHRHTSHTKFSFWKPIWCNILLTSVKLKKSPMPPTNCSTCPAYCWMMFEQGSQVSEGLLKHIYRKRRKQFNKSQRQRRGHVYKDQVAAETRRREKHLPYGLLTAAQESL